MIDFDNVKLGKKLGVVQDRRTIRARTVLEAPDSAIVVPKKHKIAGKISSVPMFANDDFGDCTCASQGHRVVIQENSSWQKEVQLTDEDVLAVYAAVTGFRRDDPNTDNGAYELDILNYMVKVGMGKERDGSSHKIGAFVKVDHKNHEEVLRAHYVFGGLKVCAGLPLSASDQMRQGAAWDLTTGPRARWGSWGGHSMYSHAYVERGIQVYTWEQEQMMTWAWWDEYVDEVYALISEDYFRRSGKTPQGFSMEALNNQLVAIRG